MSLKLKPNSRLVRCRLKLEEFDYQIKSKKRRRSMAPKTDEITNSIKCIDRFKRRQQRQENDAEN